MTKQQNNEIQQQILNFLKDNDKKQVTIKQDGYDYETLFYKIGFNDFDYVYCIDYIRDRIFDTENKYNNNFACIIDKKTNKIYFDRYELYKNFEFYDRETQKIIKCEEYEALKGQNEKELNEEINAKFAQKINQIAKNIDAIEISEDDIKYQREEAERLYYLGLSFDNDYNFLHKSSRDVVNILKYMQNKNKYIDDLIAKNKDKLTEQISTKKSYNQAKLKFLQEIETSEEYKYLRLAKQIKNSIPEYAKQVVLYYTLNNGDVLQGKFNAEAFAYMPYCTDNKEDMHYSSYNLDSNARKKINQVQSHDDYIKVKNILKIAYNGKTIYQQK